MSDVTQLLSAIDAGNRQAADQLLPLVYDDLRRLAARKMARESASHTFQPTALVHEVWLRLGVAVPTAKQWWAYARAWLRLEVSGPGAGKQ